jgi:hypothetical protein
VTTNRDPSIVVASLGGPYRVFVDRIGLLEGVELPLR